MPYKDKNKQREYQRLYAANRRKEWLEKNGPCAKCGSWDDLEVDHKNPNDKISHNVWSWSEDRRNEELAKCWVLCYNCHLYKTIKERETNPEHGTLAKYKHRKNSCKCEKCKEANARYEYERRGGRDCIGVVA